jgi:hypothetical protein
MLSHQRCPNAILYLSLFLGANGAAEKTVKDHVKKARNPSGLGEAYICVFRRHSPLLTMSASMTELWNIWSVGIRRSRKIIVHVALAWHLT